MRRLKAAAWVLAFLLSVGTLSLTAFAAEGWSQSGSQWVYYDSYGDRVYNTWKKGADNKLVAKPVSTDAGNLATAGADGAVLVSKEGITDAVKEIVTESLTSPDTSPACDMISETEGNQLTCDNGKLMIVSDYGTM